jgi:acetyl-CoA C-acetyltransferase
LEGAVNRVVVVDGTRTLIGDLGGAGGALKDVPARELGATAREALRRSGVSGTDVDEVVMGCVGQVGGEAFNARRVALGAGLPAGAPAYTVNRFCGSGLQAIWSAAMRIRCGSADIAPAGGDESMSRMPFYDFGPRGSWRLGDRRLVDGTVTSLGCALNSVPPPQRPGSPPSPRRSFRSGTCPPTRTRRAVPPWRSCPDCGRCSGTAAR